MLFESGLFLPPARVTRRSLTWNANNPEITLRRAVTALPYSVRYLEGSRIGRNCTLLQIDWARIPGAVTPSDCCWVYLALWTRIHMPSRYRGPMIAPSLARAVFGVSPESWAAWGVWATLAVYCFIAFFALRQVREARILRIEQSRPFVTVDAKFRSVALFLSVKNIGRTAAEEVQVRLDQRLVSANPQIERDLGFQDKSVFAGSMPLMAPERELLFLFDRFPDRAESDFPMQITGTVHYRRHGARKPYVERFVIDLSVWIGARLPDKALPELVEAVGQLRGSVDSVASAIRSMDEVDSYLRPNSSNTVGAADRLERRLAEISYSVPAPFSVEPRPVKRKSFRRVIGAIAGRCQRLL